MQQFLIVPVNDRQEVTCAQRAVVRGGYGIFFSPVYGQIPDVAQTLGVLDAKGKPVTDLTTCSASPNACFRQIAQIFVPLTGAPGTNPSLTSAAIFQTLFAQGKVQCTTPAPGDAACITQAELGIEREILKGLSVSGSYIYVHTSGLPVALDINLLPAPFVPAGPAGIPIRQWSTSAGSPCAGANVFNCFVNPVLLQNNQYSSAGAALYHGGILEIKKRFSDHFTLLGSYTYSKAIDTVTDFNSDFGPMDQTNLAAERGRSTFDQRHKVVFAAALESFWKNRFLSGFQMAHVVRYNSSHPFNLLAGTNVNNDRHSTNDRPPGAGRNTGIGPDYVTFDMRLSRQFNQPYELCERQQCCRRHRPAV